MDLGRRFEDGVEDACDAGATTAEPGEVGTDRRASTPIAWQARRRVRSSFYRLLNQ
jgi:hypothetical protein